MSLVSAIVSKNYQLKKNLRIARLDKTPEEMVKSGLKNGLMMAGTISVLLFFYFDKTLGPVEAIPVIFVILAVLFYKFNMLKIKSRIIKRQKLIDRDVLFAGRYLLVKLNSGQPLINALVDASKSYGVASSYFKEIVKDIELGKPLENALSDASEYSPSEKFKKILFQISNALKIGIDVTDFLDATLNEIAQQQLIEITRYGKKLSSVTLFYMLFAIVLPSLGLTIFILVASLAAISVDLTFFIVILFFLAVIQVMFLIVYKSIRPDINI